MSKSIKKYWFIIMPIVATYFYNMFLGTIDISFSTGGNLIELFKFLIIYNILFNLVMLFLAKVFKVNIAKNYFGKLEKIFVRR